MDKVAVDQVALAGTGIAGVIAISASEGAYEPFDAVAGTVLAIVLISLYRPRPAQTTAGAWAAAVPAAAVGALLFCLIISPLVESIVPDPSTQNRSLAISSTLSIIWLFTAAVGATVLAHTAHRPAPRP
ncbi:hypothetical protein [Asanoa iriomotensis]|uniref:SPW repeat-containing protein n=1 Tax=Asanoa iriomotensis TaxID=234613 RepID=A0ABQ4C620_9ACTN|nr:hypothetical protein [Asanoa iriomotensis]GIF58237.1 hypothetical protein Air01nite_43320 [Asanoa iriomotensis]